VCLGRLPAGCRLIALFRLLSHVLFINIQESLFANFLRFNFDGCRSKTQEGVGIVSGLT